MLTIISKPDYDILPAGNPIWFKVGTTSQLTAVLRLNVSIYATTSSSPEALVTTLQFLFDTSNSSVSFDVHSVIKKIIEPANNQINSISDNNFSVKFRLSVFETNIPDNTPSGTISSDYYYALKCTLNWVQASSRSSYHFENRFINKFLTEMPKARIMHGDLPIALSYANFTKKIGYQLYAVYFKIKYEDDSVYEVSYSSGLEYAKSHTVFFLASHLKFTTKKVRQLIVKLQEETSQNNFTDLDMVTYNYVHSTRRARHFIYQNNIGGYDYFTCTGLMEQRLSASVELFSRTIAKNDYTSQESDMSFVNYDAKNMYRINTGVSARHELACFLYFFSSPVRYLYLQNETFFFRLLPIVSSLDAIYRKDKDYSNSLTFDFQPSFNAKNPFPLI